MEGAATPTDTAPTMHAATARLSEAQRTAADIRRTQSTGSADNRTRPVVDSRLYMQGIYRPSSPRNGTRSPMLREHGVDLNRPLMRVQSPLATPSSGGSGSGSGSGSSSHTEAAQRVQKQLEEVWPELDAFAQSVQNIERNIDSALNNNDSNSNNNSDGRKPGESKTISSALSSVSVSPLTVADANKLPVNSPQAGFILRNPPESARPVHPIGRTADSPGWQTAPVRFFGI